MLSQNTAIINKEGNLNTFSQVIVSSTSYFCILYAAAHPFIHYIIWLVVLLVFSTGVQSTINVALPLRSISYLYAQRIFFAACLDGLFDCCQVSWSTPCLPLIISVPQVLCKIRSVIWMDRKWMKTGNGFWQESSCQESNLFYHVKQKQL